MNHRNNTKTGVMICNGGSVTVNEDSNKIWVIDKDMGTIALRTSVWHYAGLNKHILIPMSKLDITRKSMNVSISKQSDMRKMAAIIATLASYGHEQARMTLTAVPGSLTPPRALLEG